MREQYRRYWSERRHNWYREHRGRDLGSNRYEGRERGYENEPRYDRSRTPDRQAGGIRDRNDDSRKGRRDGTRNGNGQLSGGDGRGGGAVPLPDTGAPQGQSREQNYGRADAQPNGQGGGTSARAAH